MARWKKEVFNLHPQHRWTAKPGYRIFVADKGAVRFSFPQATIQFPALSDTNVGFKVLREFTVTFDQKNRRMKLEQGSMSGAG